MTEKLVISACCDESSIPMPICNRFHERLANNDIFFGVPLFKALLRRLS